MILYTHENIYKIFTREGVKKYIMNGNNIYISGPITGVENWQDNFVAAEKELLELPGAFFVINPLTVSITLEKEFEQAQKGEPSYTDYMRRDISRLVECNAICMLPGWKHSKGARLEYRIAKILNMQILEFKPE
ncbi:MAG: DUF4406 domain-containing protein [Treponema sp.]